jgi:hypothetical protein
MEGKWRGTGEFGRGTNGGKKAPKNVCGEGRGVIFWK